jgi:hypothetical protein
LAGRLPQPMTPLQPQRQFSLKSKALNEKPRQDGGAFRKLTDPAGSALTGFEPGLRLVNDVYAAFAAHDTTVAVTLLQRAE